MARARNGDRDAFGELYRLHHPALFRLARFHLGSGAEDAVAETFLRAWAGLSRYRDTGAPFVAWLYGIARHVAADQLRAGRRTEPRGEMPDAAVVEEPDDRIVLAAAMARLPDDQRKVVEMKYLLGMTNPQVAEVLGRSTGAVNALQWRGVRALKEMLRG